MPSKSQTLHDIAVTRVHSTPKAVLFNDGSKDFWVPKSLLTENDGWIQVEDNKDGSCTLTAPEWWLQEHGLI